MKKVLLVALIVFTGHIYKISAQFQELTELIQSGSEDFNKIANAYSAPFAKGMIYGMGNGWYNTAKTHGILGFDLTIVGLNYSIAPTDETTFDIKGLKLETFKDKNGNDLTGTAPTIFGEGTKDMFFSIQKEVSISSTLVTNNLNTLASQAGITDPLLLSKLSTVQSQVPEFTQNASLDEQFGPIPLAGIPNLAGSIPIPDGLLGTPMPYIQLGVGLPLDFDIIGRYLPPLPIGDLGTFSTWGFGVKHEFKRWIPFLKSVPINISGLFAYNTMNMEVELDYKGFFEPNIDDYIHSSDWEKNFPTNQQFVMDVNSTTVQLLISKKLLFITPYVGLGITSGSFKLGFDGDYVIPGIDIDATTLSQSLAAGQTDLGSIVKPTLNKESVIFGEGAGMQTVKGPVIEQTVFTPNLTLGVRVQFLLLLSIHAQYTLQPYRTFNAGLGINFR